MSDEKKWKLTENGIFSLFQEDIKNEICVQVIFMTQKESIYYLRVSDGQRISPVVFLLNKFINSMFAVGSVIAVKEVHLKPYEDKEVEEKLSLEDPGLHHLYIKSYSVLASQKTVGRLLGTLDVSMSYREALRYAWCAMKKRDRDGYKLDINLRWDLERCKPMQKEGELLREHGNKFFKQQNYTEAIALYDMAKLKDPFDCRVWSNCSHAHFKLGEYSYAEQHALIAIKMNPFYGKAYYRAGQAAIKDMLNPLGEFYARNGIFLCGETKELRQILEEASSGSSNSPGSGEDKLQSSVHPSSPVHVMTASEATVTSTISMDISLETAEIKNGKQLLTQKSVSLFKESQEPLLKKRAREFLQSNGFAAHGKENKEQPPKDKKTPKKLKKSGNEERAREQEEKTSKEVKNKEKEEKRTQDSKEEKITKPKNYLNGDLKEGQRLFQLEHFTQAMEMYNKYLSTSGLLDNISSNIKTGSNERQEVQVIHFILGMCKVQSGRGYIYEGLETMQLLCDDQSKFPNKPAARYWLAITFEKICCFKLAQKHAVTCRESLKKLKTVKPIKWPGTDQVIPKTLPEYLENECKQLLSRPSSARPSPKAKCRHKNCRTTQGVPYAKEEIYLTDPDFKGFLNVMCEEDCTVSYHPCCWKVFKEQHDRGLGRMSDKDFLGLTCMTPDCGGRIFCIQIYDDNGDLKNEVVKDKKERKNQPAPVKQKKKKDKKKDKGPAPKKRIRTESVCEDAAGSEETSPVTENAGQNVNSNKPKPSTRPAVSNLPIDPESLENAQVTILKPGAEVETTQPTSTKNKKKKKNKNKSAAQPNLLGDPLEADQCVQNEYIARLRVLQQQRDALEADEGCSVSKPVTFSSAPSLKPVMLLDPDNPFYLPHHLRDNPEELESVLQKKLLTSSPPGLKQETINTLLDFMYDWLKAEGPMSVSDARLSEQVTENFPPEARDYVNHCGGITGLLMQSVKFAMIDNIICVRDHVVQAQEMMCRDVTDKMTRSRYLVRYSDGQKAKKFTHLLDDTKSTCSTASSSSLLAGSLVSHTSKDSMTSSTIASNFAKWQNDKLSATTNAAKEEEELLKFNPLAVPILNPAAPEFEPNNSHQLEEEEVEEDEVEDMEPIKWSNGGCDDIEIWAAQAGEKVHYLPDGEDEEEEEEEQEEELTEPFQSDDEQEEEDDLCRTQYYLNQLNEEKESLTRDLQNMQEQNQVLNDRLYQTKSQSKSEIKKLKEQVEELTEQNKELTSDKHNLQSQKDSELKKCKSDLLRVQEDLKNAQSRFQSMELKHDRLIDQNNELQTKLAGEMDLNTQLKEEMEKMKNLQESLTSCSRRAREAELKYLCTKKELVEASLVREIKRLTEEAAIMRQMMVKASSDTLPDHSTLTRTIVAWDDLTKTLLDQQRILNEEGTRLLGMISQGRPLSALPSGDLSVPAIPYCTVAPLLHLSQANPNKPSLSIPEPPKTNPTHPIPQPPSPPPKATPPLPPTSLAPTEPPVVKMPPPGMVYVNGTHLMPPTSFSGAIPKATPSTQPSKSPAEVPSPPQVTDSNQLFVGQLPWDYSETDVKNLFSRLFGEVVSATVFDKGCNADGRPVPKYGFVTFRNADDCSKALSARPIYVGNHALNVQAKEGKKPTKSPGTPVGGLAGPINEPDASATKSSAYGLSDISVNASAEANKSAVHTLTTPTLHQPPTLSVIKPKFQKLLTTNPTVGAIGTLPPKLVRPQPKMPPSSSKLVNQANTGKEESVTVTPSPSYQRLIEICKQRVGKDFSSPDICAALREVRIQNNNSLSGMTTERIVERVKQHLRTRRPNAGPATVAPWAGLAQGAGTKTRPDWQGPTSEEAVKEESCPICLEPLNASNTVPLQCQHVFHERCIKDWLKRQSNCPNCRKFALMIDEYPTLPHA